MSEDSGLANGRDAKDKGEIWPKAKARKSTKARVNVKRPVPDEPVGTAGLTPRQLCPAMAAWSMSQHPTEIESVLDLE